MKTKTGVVACCCVFALSSAGRAQWIDQFGSSGNDQTYSVATDPSGNIYAGGSAAGSVFGQTAIGGDDAVLVKYDPSGQVIWAKQFGTTVADSVKAVSTMGASGVIVGGATTGSLQGANKGNLDCFVRLYDSSGATVWTTQFGTSTAEEVFAVAPDGQGHIYATGYTGGSFAGTNAGQKDIFVVQLDATTGAILWKRQYGSTDVEFAHAVAVDGNGNVFVGGFTLANLFGTSAGGYDSFVLKLDSQGNTLWSKQYGVSSSDEVYGLAVDANNNVIAAGLVNGKLGAASFGADDGYVRKLSGGDGSTIWTTQFGSSGSDDVFGLARSASGNLLVGGSTTGVLQGGSSFGGTDAFTLTLDDAGTVTGVQQFGTAGTDIINGIALDADGHMFAGGRTDGSFPGYTNAGLIDGFATELSGVVPEPSAAVLLATGVVGLVCRRRRQS